MELEELISRQTQIPLQELRKKLDMSSDKKTIYIKLKEGVSRDVFKQIASIVKSLDGEYVSADRCFKLPNRRPALWADVAAMLKEVPEETRSNLRFEIIVKPIGFLEKQKFKQLAMSMNKLGGIYLSEERQGYFKLTVGPPEINIENELLDKIQDMNTPAFQRAVSIQKLIDECHFNQETIANKLKRSRSWVANHTRLLKLKDKLPEALLNRLSEGAARDLLAVAPEKLDQISSEYSQLLKKGDSLTKQTIARLLKIAEAK